MTESQGHRSSSQSVRRVLERRVTELERHRARLRRLTVELTSTEQRERKRLAAVLHDEIQQLLVAAKLELQQLRRELAEREAATMADRALERLDESVATLRDLTRELRPPVLYEAGLIPALQWLASGSSPHHRLQVRFHARGHELAAALPDDIKSMLYECVRELLANVSRHAGVDRATLRVEAREGRLRLVVQDRGRGFDPQQPAEREDAGYGLFGIGERIAALGGSMTIRTRPGKGTRIELEVPVLSMRAQPSGEIQLPRVTHGKDGPHAAIPHGHADGHRLRVLVVDDHVIVREGIARMVGGDDRLVVVGEAVNGYEAIEAVEQCHPEVVLMDLNMPRMNGFEATREIHRTHPEITIIGLSVEDNEATARSMIEAGASGFISKSGDSERLITTILQLTHRLS